MFFSVVTKNLIWEILIKNLTGWTGLRMTGLTGLRIDGIDGIKDEKS